MTILLLGSDDSSQAVSHLSNIEDAFVGRAEYVKSLDLLKISKLDPIYAYNSYYPSNIMPLLAKALNKDLIYAPQMGGFHKLRSSGKNFLFRLILRIGGFRAIRCISRWEYDRYREFGIPEEKLFYCPLGIDYQSFSQIGPDFGSKEIFSVSNSRELKDIESQVRAIGELAEDYPEVRLNIIGGWETTEYREKIEGLVSKLDLEQNIVFHGYKTHDEMQNIMKECSAFIHTSEFESQGLSIYEAAAAGFPICVSDVPVHNQNFERFKHPQGDHEALAEDIRAIFEMDEEEKQEISEDMRELAEDFSYEKEKERLEEFFERIDKDV